MNRRGVVFLDLMIIGGLMLSAFGLWGGVVSARNCSGPDRGTDKCRMTAQDREQLYRITGSRY